MEVLNTTGLVLRINAPEWFELPAFRLYLDRQTHPQQQHRLATFHRYGDPPNSWSDVFIPFEAYPIEGDVNGQQAWTAEGTDICESEELAEVWQAITDAAQRHQVTHGIVWISNIR
jgi:hypothetical protein